MEAYVDIGQAAGADLLCGGRRPDERALANGFFFEPTIFARVEPGSRLEQEEIFGPVLSVIRVSTPDEAFAVNNDVKYGLSSSVYTRDVNVAYRALVELDNGITYINAPTIGAEAHLPFGGVKQTGNGHREGGWEVYEFYSETKVGYIDFSGSLQRAQIDNYACSPTQRITKASCAGPTCPGRIACEALTPRINSPSGNGADTRHTSGARRASAATSRGARGSSSCHRRRGFTRWRGARSAVGCVGDARAAGVDRGRVHRAICSGPWLSRSCCLVCRVGCAARHGKRYVWPPYRRDRSARCRRSSRRRTCGRTSLGDDLVRSRPVSS